MSSLHVLLSGGGSPSFSSGSALPRPFALVNGTPLAAHVLASIPSVDVFVILSRALVEVNAETTLPHLGRKKRVRCVTLPRATRGPIETAYLGLLSESAALDHSRPVVFYDNDTIYDLKDVAFPERAHFMGLTQSADAKAIAPYCYVRCADGVVVEVAEKRKISADYAVGVYGFSSVTEFLRLAKSIMLEGDGSAHGAFFMSRVYSRLLAEGSRVEALHVRRPLCLGTPSDIAANAALIPFQQLRFCFDIDNTLVHYRRLPDGEYRDCEPVPRMVELVRSLKAAGHVIILSTARGMATAKSNLGAAQAKIAAETFENLKKLDIPYDEIYFGKPHADVYIDDKAFNPFLNVFDAIGMPALELDIARQLRDASGTLQSNRFNSIAVVRGIVHKRGPLSSMTGEEYFYRVTQSTPIAQYFAKFHGSSSDTSSITLRLEYIDGCTLYELLRTDLLTTRHIDYIMEAMDAVHFYSGIPISIPHSAVFDNYVTKLKARIGDKVRYPFEDVPAVVNAVGDYVRSYLDSPRFVMASVVHGDPWFSNTLLLGATRVVFLDMKGDVAGHLTTNGDPLTDFGKFYQSLFGFDGLLAGEPTPEAVLEPLRTYFLQKIAERGYVKTDLDAVTACLIAKTLHFMDVDIETREQIWNIVRNLANSLPK